MILPGRLMKPFGRLLLAGLLVCAMLAATGLPGPSYGDEGKQEEGYVRNVDSSPSLAETEEGAGWSYNSDYLFAISKAIRDSSMHPAAKVVLFIPAIPLDIAFSPFAALAGLFGH